MEVAREVKRRAEAMFGRCEVYVVGSFARGEHRLSSDFDVLVVAEGIPDRVDFEWYYDVARRLVDEEGVNVHLLSPSSFARLEKMYKDRVRVE
ncbi:nucleotidyltransferase domain-containing protein [Infirmifilum lucidum]|uniref:Nucleotidyltransferase domain-containing protein n=1 Tax=Infirmifilum lucidum TaxID=2776706 RepID=A0A7L9FJ13_9CREN|nr:nucleotidyltransferase domain-containing protein [Infirmifilum lucidum]